MFSKTKMVLAAALVLGSGVATLANDRDGEEGGFVLSGSMDGVNPAYHPDLHAGYAAQQRKAGGSLGSVASRSKAGTAFGYVAPHTKILRPTIAAPKEDNYGPEAGKD